MLSDESSAVAFHRLYSEFPIAYIRRFIDRFIPFRNNEGKNPYPGAGGNQLCWHGSSFFAAFAKPPLLFGDIIPPQPPGTHFDQNFFRGCLHLPLD